MLNIAKIYDAAKFLNKVARKTELILSKTMLKKRIEAISNRYQTNNASLSVISLPNTPVIPAIRMEI